MTWATEFKNLVGDIQSSKEERAGFVKDNKRRTHSLLSDYDRQMAGYKRQFAEMAKDLKDFLAKNETARMEEFRAMMGEIKNRINAAGKEVKELAGETKDFLTKSEQARLTGFKKLMQFITSDIAAIKRTTGSLLEDSSKTLGNFSKERKEAAGAWATLSKRKARTETAESKAVKTKKAAKEKTGRKTTTEAKIAAEAQE